MNLIEVSYDSYIHVTIYCTSSLVNEQDRNTMILGTIQMVITAIYVLIYTNLPVHVPFVVMR